MYHSFQTFEFILCNFIQIIMMPFHDTIYDHFIIIALIFNVVRCVFLFMYPSHVFLPFCTKI